MTTLPDEPSGIEPPELPEHLELLDWTRNYWVSLWESPMALLWKPFDVPSLIRLAILQDQAVRGEAGAEKLSEIRQIEDRFGLSPLARKRLQWEIGKARSEQTRRPSRTASAAPARRLKAV